MPAIRELAATTEFREDPAWLAEQLIPPITTVRDDDGAELLATGARD